MQLSSPVPPLAANARPGIGRARPASGAGADLSAALAPAGPQAGADAAEGASADHHEQLVRQTQQWVAQTFFGVLLKQMHESPFKSELFDGGRGGQAFAPMMDQKLIEHMSRGAGRNLVRSVVRKLEAGAAYRKQQATEGGMTRPAEPPEGITRPRRASGGASAARDSYRSGPSGAGGR